MMLARCHEMLNALKETNKTSEKICIVRRFQDLRPLLELVINPQNTTGVTAAQIKTYEAKHYPKFPNKTYENDIMTLLEKLISRKYTGHEAKEAVVSLMNTHPAFRETILKLAELKLKIGMQEKQLNKAFDISSVSSSSSLETKDSKSSSTTTGKKLTKEYKVALANDYSKQKAFFQKSIANGDTWYISRKLDGVRCQLFTGEGCKSRTGMKFTSTATMEKMAKECVISGFVLDGEVCVVEVDEETKKETENFQKAVGAIRKKNVDMKSFRFYVFDLFTREEFEAGTSQLTLAQRWERMTTVLEKLFADFGNYFQPVEQVLYNEKNFEKLQQVCEKENWEGLMLRKDTLYKAKRSNDILKVKTFSSQEYTVLDVQMGTKTILNQSTQRPEERQVLAAVKIKHDNKYDVWVGSGFTDEQRLHYFHHPEDILSHVIEVQYFEETTNKDGEVSLRFPTIKHIYETDERDT